MFSALDIEHSLLRAHLSEPKIPSPYIDASPFFVKIQSTDRRAVFKVSKKFKHVTFALFIPTVYHFTVVTE